jgi:hypothetical protein
LPLAGPLLMVNFLETGLRMGAGSKTLLRKPDPRKRGQPS